MIAIKILKEHINYYWKSSVLILVLTTISNILSIAYVYFFKNIIDNLVIDAPLRVTLKWVGIVFIILIINTGLSFFIYDFLLKRLKIEITTDLRSKFFSQYLLFPFSDIKKMTDGAIKSRILEDTVSLSNYISLYYFMLIGNTLRFMYTFFALYQLDALVSLIVLLSVPLYYILSKHSLNKISIYSQKERENTDALYNSLEEKMNNIKTIKIYKAEKDIAHRFNKHLANWQKSQNDIMFWNAIFALIKDFLTSLLPIIIITISILRIKNNLMTIGALVATISLLDAVYIPVDELLYFTSMKYSIAPIVERTKNFLNNATGLKKKEYNAVYAKGDYNSIHIENLNFSYEPSHYIFKHFNFNVKGNGLYLIKGKNGCGKTTLFNIISGLQEIQEGTVKINITEDFENKIVYMPQENEIFNDSVLNNITVYNTTLEAQSEIYKNIFPIEQSHKDVFAYSGGEERKISVMRLLSRNANIYLLDEPFENLDLQAKNQLKKILKELSSHAIVLFISHDNYFRDEELSIINID